MVTLNNMPVRENSSGKEFAHAYSNSGLKTQVQYDYTLTEEFKPGENRDRIAMVSWVMKRRLMDNETVAVWSESRRPIESTKSQSGAKRWKEFHVDFGGGFTLIKPIQAWVQVSDEILADPDGLGDFIDYRLIPRLGTVENEKITIGEGGILNHPDLSTYTYDGDFISGLLSACNEIEQTAATAHVIIVNSEDYYGSILPSGLLQNLHANGNVIIRTRMVGSGCAVVGDFNVATRFYHLGKSEIRFGKPPVGMFKYEKTALCAETYVGVSLNLPTHVFHVTPHSK